MPAGGSNDSTGPGRAAPDLDLEALYARLRVLASAAMRRERPGHTLQPTALIHEAWRRLDGAQAAASGREHFMAMAATAMRRVLVDHARKRASLKRDLGRVTLAEDPIGAGSPLDLLAINDVLEQLERRHPRAARVVELRVFGGLTHPEIAAELDLARSTVDADWAVARAFLASGLKNE